MLSIITLVIELLIKAIFRDSIEDVTEIMDIIFIIVFSIVFMFDIGHNNKIGNLSTPLFLGYNFRLFLLIFDRYGQSVFQLPNSGADSEMYYHSACSYASNNDVGRGGNFSLIMGTLFRFIGDSRLYGQFIVVLFSIVSLVLFAMLLRRIDIDHKIKYNVFGVVCLLPNLAILSSVFLRESIIAMCITLSFYVFFKWLIYGNIFYYILAIVFAFFASTFHSGSIAIAMGYIVIVLLYDRKNKIFRLSGKNLIPTALLLSVVAFLFVNYSNNFFAKMQNVNSISDIATTYAEGGSSYAQYVGNSNNPGNMIIFTPLRILFFLGSPFPWQWRGLSDIIAFCFSSLFFIIAVWSDIRFLKSGQQKNRTLVTALTIVAACTVFVFAWGVSNTGTACRHRDKITIIWGLILALTYAPENKRLKTEVTA